jgi:DNA repair exonuclease SbcCD ATPase subunit
MVPSRFPQNLITDYTDLANKSNEATRLLSEITTMQTAITDLKNAQEQANTDQNLPLPASIALLSSQKASRDQLAVELERKTQENTRKRREVEKLRAHLAELDRNRVDAEMFAREAEKMKNAENLQAELASKKHVGWWYVAHLRGVLRVG